MSSTRRTHLAALLGLTLTAGLAFSVAPPQPPAAPVPNYRISGPFTHENLTIFLLHGANQVKNDKILTLDEALKDRKVIVHETKNVNQLAIENVSTEDVFVQAGDMVKGGQQDRIIALDLLLPPKSGRLPIASFCVEQGRWTNRGGEDRDKFNRSGDALVTNAQKYAARGAVNQGLVWKEVRQAQGRLGMKLKASVQNPVSGTSLALTLEHKKLLEGVDAYVKKLQGSLDGQTDVIGFAVAINGKVNNADVYANAALFRKLWPKLLKGSAVEAVSEKKEAKGTEKVQVPVVKPEAVTAFLAEAARGKRTVKKTLQNQCETKCESEKNVLFETRAPSNAVLRSSYVGK
jgi:hypothetical protein